MCNISRPLLKNTSTLLRGANPTFGWCRNHPGGAHSNTWRVETKVGGGAMTHPKKLAHSKRRFWNRTSKINHLLVNQKWQGKAPYIVSVATEKEIAVQVDVVPTVTAAVSSSRTTVTGLRLLFVLYTQQKGKKVQHEKTRVGLWIRRKQILWFCLESCEESYPHFLCIPGSTSSHKISINVAM